MNPQHEAHFRAVENLIYEWARAIDEDRVEAIAELLQPDGRYLPAATVEWGKPRAARHSAQNHLMARYGSRG